MEAVRGGSLHPLPFVFHDSDLGTVRGYGEWVVGAAQEKALVCVAV